MPEYALHLNSLSLQDVLLCVVTFATILSFSVLAARADTRIWRRVNRSDGDRRAVQQQITLGRSHLR